MIQKGKEYMTKVYENLEQWRFCHMEKTLKFEPATTNPEGT
jgi:hypothetical protein